MHNTEIFNTNRNCPAEFTLILKIQQDYSNIYERFKLLGGFTDKIDSESIVLNPKFKTWLNDANKFMQFLTEEVPPNVALMFLIMILYDKNRLPISPVNTPWLYEWFKRNSRLLYNKDVD